MLARCSFQMGPRLQHSLLHVRAGLVALGPLSAASTTTSASCAPPVPPAATPASPAASSTPPAAPPPPSRPVTRLQTGSWCPVDRYGFSPSTASPILTNYRSALADPNWWAAMSAEYDALLTNSTWRLVPWPPGANIVTSKWLFEHKFHSDGTRRAGLSAASPSRLVSTTTTPSARLSNRRQSAPSSSSPPHALGPFISWA